MESNDYIIFHGRFQPYHIGHDSILNYLANNYEEEIIIGIINPDPLAVWEGDDKEFPRFRPELNPLSYWDRYSCITSVLKNTPTNEKVYGIIPLPRPSVNKFQCERFIPLNQSKLVITLRYGDETEQWKREMYEKQGIKTLVIYDKDLPLEVGPLSATLIRDLMVLNDETWKRLVPVSTHSYLSQKEIISKFTKNVNHQDALCRITELAEISPYRAWCKEFLSNYLAKDRKMNNMEKSKKVDILGAVAESVFGVFPIFKGLLRLRDDKLDMEKQEELLNAIKKQGDVTVMKVENIIKEKFLDEIKLLRNPSMRKIYSFALSNIDTNLHSSSINRFIEKDPDLDDWRKNLSDESYYHELVNLYDTNVEDLWILVKDYGFEPSKIKGSTPRAKIRNFLQQLASIQGEKVLSILGAIYREHRDITVFEQTYRIASYILEC